MLQFANAIVGVVYLHSSLPPQKTTEASYRKNILRTCRDGNPKKQPNKVLHRNAFTDYQLYIFAHFSNPQHIAFPYMPHQPYSQPFEHIAMFSHIRSSHYNLINDPLQQPALYTQHCSHHITIHTSSNKQLQLYTMQTTSISLIHTTD